MMRIWKTPSSGHRFLADEAERAGEAMCDRTVWRICRDNGWWSVFGKFRRALDRHDMVGSVGRVGAAGDNAAMESLFSLLQNNVLNRRSWATREELRFAIVSWIERTYHCRRRQARLGCLTPVEYEAIMYEQVALAA